MKRRTIPRPATPRRSVPASSLEHYFPGIDRMSDIEGFKMLYQVCAMAAPSDSDLAYRVLALFNSSRGLVLTESGSVYRGAKVLELRKGADLLASFSSGSF